MDESTSIPSLSLGVVGSRFVSSDEIESAKARREEQWKAAYARLGQEPPPQQVEDSYDGRSLAEKLAANRIAKQEEWEEKTKLANQFRALEEDEIMFLDSIREKEEAEERQRKEQDGEEVKSFKEAVAARSQATNPPPLTTATTKAASKSIVGGTLKKDAKKSLKGVVVKKKAKPADAKSSATPTPDSKKATKSNNSAKDRTIDEDKASEEPASKRRRISES